MGYQNLTVSKLKIYLLYWKNYTQVFLVYLQWFWSNSLLKCTKNAPKISYFYSLKGLKIIDVGFLRNGLSAMFVMISNMSPQDCNSFHAQRVNGSKNDFLGSTSLWRFRSRGICSPRSSGTKFSCKKL